MTAAAPTEAGIAPAIRRLYFVRFAFALVWAVLLFITASSIGPVSATLLVLYPLFDVAAAIVDARSSRVGGSAPDLYLNIAISTLAVIGLAVAVTLGMPSVLRVWGIWAVVSGIVQLAVGLRRRALGGQWAMIASGGISVLAGVSFYLQASGDRASLGMLAGYALLGGIFFLVSALRLGRYGTQHGQQRRHRRRRRHRGGRPRGAMPVVRAAVTRQRPSAPSRPGPPSQPAMATNG